MDQILCRDLFPQVDEACTTEAEKEEANKLKCLILAKMLVACILLVLDIAKVSDMDSWSCKRLRGPGTYYRQLMYPLWQKQLRKKCSEISPTAAPTLGQLANILKASTYIREAVEKAFRTKQWNGKHNQAGSSLFTWSTASAQLPRLRSRAP